MRNLTIIAATATGFLALSPAYAEPTDFFELAKTGIPQTIQTAIDKGTDVNALDNAGRNALMLAAVFNQNPEVITRS